MKSAARIKTMMPSTTGNTTVKIFSTEPVITRGVTAVVAVVVVRDVDATANNQYTIVTSILYIKIMLPSFFLHMTTNRNDIIW